MRRWAAVLVVLCAGSAGIAISIALSAPPPAVKAFPDNFHLGARPAATLDLLANDTQGSGRDLIVNINAGTVQGLRVTDKGYGSILVAPVTPGSSGDVTFSYTLRDGRTTSRANVRVCWGSASCPTLTKSSASDEETSPDADAGPAPPSECTDLCFHVAGSDYFSGEAVDLGTGPSGSTQVLDVIVENRLGRSVTFGAVVLGDSRVMRFVESPGGNITRTLASDSTTTIQVTQVFLPSLDPAHPTAPNVTAIYMAEAVAPGGEARTWGLAFSSGGEGPVVVPGFEDCAFEDLCLYRLPDGSTTWQKAATMFEGSQVCSQAATVACRSDADCGAGQGTCVYRGQHDFGTVDIGSTKTASLALVYNSVAATGAPLPLQALEAAPFRLLADGVMFTGGSIAPGEIKYLGLEAAPTDTTQVSRAVKMIAGFGGAQLGLLAKVRGRHVGASCERCEIYIGGILQADGSHLDFGTQPSGSTLTVEGFVRNNAEVTAFAQLSVNGDNSFFKVQQEGPGDGKTIPAHGQIAFTMEVLFWPGPRNAQLVLREPVLGSQIYATVHLTSEGEGPLPEAPDYPDCLTSKYHYCIFLDGKLADGLAKLQCSDGSGPCADTAGVGSFCNDNRGVCLFVPALPSRDEPAVHHANLALLGSSRTPVAIVNNMEAGFPFQVAAQRGSVKVLKDGVPIDQNIVYCNDGSGPCPETAHLDDPCGNGGVCKPALFVYAATSPDRVAEFEVDHPWQPSGGTAGSGAGTALGVVDLILSNVHLTHSLYFVANCPSNSVCTFVRLQPGVGATLGPRGIVGRQGDQPSEDYVFFNASSLDILDTNLIFRKNGISSGWLNFETQDGFPSPQSDPFDLPGANIAGGPGIIASPRVHVEKVAIRPGASGMREELTNILFQGSYIGFEPWRVTSDPGRDPYPDCAGTCLFRAPDAEFDGFFDTGPDTLVGTAGQAARPVVEIDPEVPWAGAFQVVNDSSERRRIDLEIVQGDGAFSFGSRDGAPILLNSLWLEPETGSQRIWVTVAPQFLQTRDLLRLRSRPAADEAAPGDVLEVELVNTPDRPHGECRGVCLYVDGVRQADGAAIELLGWTGTSAQKTLHVVNGAVDERPYEAILRGPSGFIETFPDVAMRCGGGRTSECRGTLAPGAFAEILLEHDFVAGSASQPLLESKAGADEMANPIVLTQWGRPTVEVVSPVPPSVENCKPRECWCTDAALANMWLEADAFSAGPGGILGVAFSLDGENVGPLLSTAPYAYLPDWDDCAGTCTVAATAFDAAGAVTSLPVELLVEECEPAVDPLALLSPRDGEQNVAPAPSFQWTAVAGAAWYEVTVRDAGGRSWTTSATVPAATWSGSWSGGSPAPATLDLGATYTWQVTARMAGARRESAPATFRILRPGVCPVSDAECIEGEWCSRCLNDPRLPCDVPNVRDPACGGKRCSNNSNIACDEPLDCGGGTCVFDFACSWHVANDPANAGAACEGRTEGAVCHSTSGTPDGWCDRKACAADEDCAAKTCSNHRDQVCESPADCGYGVCARDRAWDYGLGTDIVCGGPTADRSCGVCENDARIGCTWSGGGASWDCSSQGVFPSTGEACAKGESSGVCTNFSSYSCSAGAAYDDECRDSDVVPGVTTCAGGAGRCLATSCDADSDCGERRCGTDWENGARCNENGDCGGGTCKAGTPRAGAWCNSDEACGRGVCPAGSSANAGGACSSDAQCNAGGTGTCEDAPAGTTCTSDMSCGKCYRCTAGPAFDKDCDAEGQTCGKTGVCELNQDEGCANGWQCGSEGRCASSGAACSAGATCGRCQFNPSVACTAIGSADPACGGKRCSNSPNAFCNDPLDCGGGSCVVDKQCSWHLAHDPANAVAACAGRAEGAACHFAGSTADGWCAAKPCGSDDDCAGKVCKSGSLAGTYCTSASECGAGMCTKNKTGGAAITCSGTTSAANLQCGVCSQDSSLGCFFSGVTAPSWDCAATGKFGETNQTCTQGQTGGFCAVDTKFMCSAGAAYDAECHTGSAIAGVTTCGPGGSGKCFSPSCSVGKDTACGGLRCGSNWASGTTCNEGSDCGSGTCKAGTTNAGLACTSSTQCEGGAAAATCGPAATANAGGACTSDAQCNAGGAGSCALGGLGGGACTSDMQCGTCASNPDKGCASGWDCSGAGQCTAVLFGDKSCTAGQSCGKCPNGFRCGTPGLPDPACGGTVCSHNAAISCDPNDVAAACGAGTCKAALECGNPNRTDVAERRALCKGKTAGAQCERFYNGFSWVWATCSAGAGGEACGDNADCEEPTCSNNGAMCDLNGDGNVTTQENTAACGGMCTYGTAAGNPLSCSAYTECGVCKKADGSIATPYRGCQGSGAGQCGAGETCWYPLNPAITTCGVDPAKTCTTTSNACQSARTCNAPTCQSAGTCSPVETCNLGPDNGGECGFTHKCQSRRNWARGTLGAVASQSSTWGALPAALAADGRLDTINHTDSNAQAWWQVDLGQLRAVDTIKVYNGNACCLDRLTNFRVWADTAPCPTAAPWTLSGAAVAVGVNSGRAGAPSVFTFPSRNARCVRVQLAGTNYLHMAEVEVVESLCTFSGTSQCAPPPCNGTQCQPQFNCTGDAGQQNNCSFPNACDVPADECTTPYTCANPTCQGDGACQPDQKCELGSAAGGACAFASACTAPAGDCAFPPSAQCQAPDCAGEACAPQFDCLDSSANGCTYPHTCDAPDGACETPRACDYPWCVSAGACQVEE